MNAPVPHERVEAMFGVARRRRLLAVRVADAAVSGTVTPELVAQYAEAAAALRAFQAGVEVTVCHECGLVFAAGTRADARRERWEPFSTRTQNDLDHGPIWCPTCIDKLITDTLAVFRRGVL